MRCFKHTKTCTWKRFIRRKEFVIDNPVYTLKQVSAAIYFDFDFLASETLVSSNRDSGFFCRLYWYIQFCHPTCMLLYRIGEFELTSIYYFVILLSRASAINGQLQGELSCTIIHFNIIFQIRA